MSSNLRNYSLPAKKLISLRPLNDFSLRYVDWMVESLWNGAGQETGASRDAHDVSVASSEGGEHGFTSDGESDHSRTASPIFGHNKSYFGDGLKRMPILPPKREGLNYDFEKKTDLLTLIKPFRQERKKSCAYCKGDHLVKDKTGKTICPFLRALKCPLCGAQGGDEGHTVR